MADPLLNSVKLLIAVGGFVAKPDLLSGLKTGVSVVETLKKMIKSDPPVLSAMASELTTSAQVTFAAHTDLPPDAEILFEDMVRLSLPDAREIVAANMQADATCDVMLAKLTYIEHTRAPMPDLFRRLTVPVFERLLADQSFVSDLMPAWMADVSVQLDRVHDKLDLLLQRVGEDPRFHEEVERQRKLVAALAERYLEGSPDDFDAALAGLERALEVAAEARGRLPGNVSDAVEAVEARVRELNAEGEVDAAEEALWDELERAEAAQLRLVAAGLQQVVLTRNVDRAVELELRKLALEGGEFEDMRQVREVWYERGRDKGLRFDLEVAIGLAAAARDRAGSADETGTALNDLGMALAILGERESGTARLEEAVIALRAALEEYTRERVPLNLAGTQNNLGNALATLGERERGTVRLEAAVTAYRAALEEWTRERAPLNWAATQNNLGNALRAIGVRESGTARLEEAVFAFRAALEERTRERVPLDWAMTQNNLGAALQALGERESGTARLEEAVIALRAALEVWTRERVPLDWAMTQNNLGNALQRLGERESGTARLEEAVFAFRAAHEERTRERVPLDWAMTQGNRCILELAWFDKTGAAGHLDAAQGHLDAAREVFTQAGASQYLAMAEVQQAGIDARRSG